MKIAENSGLKADAGCPLNHGPLTRPSQVAAALSAAVLFALAQFARAQDCTRCDDPFALNKPLPDLGQGTYTNPSPSPGTTPAQGGLYPGGLNQRPANYNTEGINIANDHENGIVPRKPDGTPDPDGTDPNSKIGMISIGMCNTSKEFGGQLGIQDATKAFVYRVMLDSFGTKWKNPKLVVVDCAQSGARADVWAREDNNFAPWGELDRR